MSLPMPQDASLEDLYGQIVLRTGLRRNALHLIVNGLSAHPTRILVSLNVRENTRFHLFEVTDETCPASQGSVTRADDEPRSERHPSPNAISVEAMAEGQE